MIVDADAQTFQPLAESLGAPLTIVLGYHHSAYHEPSVQELVPQPQHIHIVGNAQVAAHLVLLDVAGTDDNHYLGIVAQLHEHFQLAVGLKSREDTTGVVVVKKLTAKF